MIEKKIYEVLAKTKGFRINDKGEFTKRAFLNGFRFNPSRGFKRFNKFRNRSSFRMSMSQYEGLFQVK